LELTVFLLKICLNFLKLFLSFKKIATNLSGEAGLSKKNDFFKR